MPTRWISPSRMLDDDRRTEALERLRYLAEAGACGVLRGESGSGKSELFRQLSRELTRSGLPVCRISLAGVSETELPTFLAAELGLGLPVASPSLVVWSLLHDFAASCRQTGSRQVFLLDDVDRGDVGLVRILDRLMEFFPGAFLLSMRPDPQPLLRRFLEKRTWLRIDLGRLSTSGAIQAAEEAVHQHQPGLRLEPEALRELIALSGGHLNRLRQLSELACLAAEVDDRSNVDGDMVRSVAEEFGAVTHP